MDVAALSAAVSGRVLQPRDESFDETCEVWNARFARRPDVIVVCRDSHDVAEVMRWRQREGVTLSVRGGGHSYAGHTIADGGVLVDLRAMSGIKVMVDDKRVEVGAGATWAELDSVTQHHGLVTTGPTVSSVGVVGSVLGGATGWLSRAFGHGVDNVVSVEMVTVGGDAVTASAHENAELFWGVRGAGHNLGVVTSVTLQLHELAADITAGQIIYPFEDAERLLRIYRDVITEADDGFQCLPFTFRVPPIDAFPAQFHGQPVLDFVVFAVGEEAARSTERLRGLEEPIVDAVGPMPYVDVQQAFDANLPAGQRYYSTAHDIAQMSDGMIDDFARFVRTSRGAFTASYLEPKGGAAARIAPDATAMGGRSAACEFHVIAGWQDASEDDAVLSWAREFSSAMAAHATGGVYVNLIGDDEGDRIGSAFSDVERVRALKREWDPDNVLRANHNVAP